MSATVFKLSGPALGVGAVLVIVAVQFRLGIGPVYLAGVLLIVAGVVGQLLRQRHQRPVREHAPVVVRVPVEGRWRGLNSPASKVPSHTHSYAQTFAIDITHEPAGSPPRAMDGVWPPMRRPEAFPSFGQPVLAPFDGVVIQSRDTSRDHLTRLSPLGLIYLLAESFVRSLGLPRHLLGNYVLIRADGTAGADGDAAGGPTSSTHPGKPADGPTSRAHASTPADAGPVAVLAHLRRGSLRVSPGDRVSAGQMVAECGNSGNSSDPHVHFQLMDGPDIETAHGLPFEWDYLDDGGTSRRGVPANEELFVAGFAGTRQALR